MVHSWVIESSNGTAASSVGSVRRHPSIAGRAVRRPGFSSKARAIFFIVSFLILFCGFSFMRSFAYSGDIPAADANEVSVTVDSGQSLWVIAREWKKSSLDTRQAVHEIMKRNGLDDAEIRAGQTLIIPAKLLS